MRWATSLGASGLILKPFEEEALWAEIRRCLGNTVPEDNFCSRAI
jgi:hypothetical protein